MIRATGWACILLLWLATGCGKVKTLADPTCDDGEQNGDETAVDCGGGCDPCESGESCERPGDCASDDCDDGTCAEVSCGDGRVQLGEDCDDDGASADCNEDCTPAACGDGMLNDAAGEECEPESDDLWARCGGRCLWGAALSGAFSDHWIPLPYPGGQPVGLQSFHFTGQRYLYDFYLNMRLDLDANEWSVVPVAHPFSGEGVYWVQGAVDDQAIWVPRDGKMHRFDLEDEEWTIAADTVPTATDSLSAAVFDGVGNIWYHGPGDDLVRYEPGDDSYESYSHTTDFPGFNVYETRMAYDPEHELIAFTGYTNDRFLIFDIAEETFHEGTPSPESTVRDNSCHDRSGHIYTGNADGSKMLRYDISEDTWEELPPLPLPHDNGSTCVVSQDGFLYYGTNSDGGGFFRLGLGVR